jgi:hypothetical protein
VDVTPLVVTGHGDPEGSASFRPLALFETKRGFSVKKINENRLGAKIEPKAERPYQVSGMAWLLFLSLSLL